MPRDLKRHPLDPAARLWRAARHWPVPISLLIGLLACAVGMVACLLQMAGWIGPEGLRW
jgi:hypothetical protein